MYSQILPLSSSQYGWSAAQSLSHLLTHVVAPRTRRAASRQRHQVRVQERTEARGIVSPSSSSWHRIAATWSGGRNSVGDDDGDDNHQDHARESSSTMPSALELRGKKMYLSCDPNALPKTALMRHQDYSDGRAATQSKTASTTTTTITTTTKRGGKRQRLKNKHRKSKRQEQKKRAKKETLTSPGASTKKKGATKTTSPLLPCSSLKKKHHLLRRLRLVSRLLHLAKQRRLRGSKSKSENSRNSRACSSSTLRCDSCQRFRDDLREHALRLLRRTPFLVSDFIPAAQRYFQQLLGADAHAASSSPAAYENQQSSTTMRRLTQMLRFCPATLLVGATVAVPAGALFSTSTTKQSSGDSSRAGVFVRGVIVDHVRKTRDLASLTVAVMIDEDASAAQTNNKSKNNKMVLLMFVPSLAFKKCSSAKICGGKAQKSFRVSSPLCGASATPALFVSQYEESKIQFQLSPNVWARIPADLVF